jgi:ribosomal protein S18 acetylase RimI-like enzyme
LKNQRRGIASRLLEQCLADLKSQGIVGFHLITAREGVLLAFYERFGFKKEERVMLMGLE